MHNRKNNIFYVGSVFLIFGFTFLLSGIFLLIISKIFIPDDLWLGPLITGLTSAILGIVFITVGTVMRSSVRKQQKKAARLMSGGLCFEGRVTRVYENPTVRINYRSPLIIECVYTDNSGRDCLVKSGNVWLDYPDVRESDIQAKVWVNPADPRDYHVEVTTALSGGDVKYDVDYR